MNALKFIGAWAILSAVLLIVVVAVNLVDAVIMVSRSGADTAAFHYSNAELLWGAVSEIVRAFFTLLLFPQLKKAGTSYGFAIYFGLLVSLLIASAWIVLGAAFFVLKDPLHFLISDSIILLLQGILSGIGLQVLYKRQFI